MQNNGAIGESWEEVRYRIFTPEEIAESDLRVALIGESSVHDRSAVSHRNSLRR